LPKINLVTKNELHYRTSDLYLRCILQLRISLVDYYNRVLAVLVLSVISRFLTGRVKYLALLVLYKTLRLLLFGHILRLVARRRQPSLGGDKLNTYRGKSAANGTRPRSAEFATKNCDKLRIRVKP